MLTSGFYTRPLLPGRVSIARFAPRFGPKPPFAYRDLAPGTWFNKVPPREYMRLYQAQLSKLDPKRVWDELHRLTAPHEPVLLCWEKVPFSVPDDWFKADPVQDGHLCFDNWCHRRVVAVWFKDTLEMEVKEQEGTSPPPSPKKKRW